MSAPFQPYIDMPYPNYALDEAAKPYEVGPVPEVTPAGNVRAIESEEERVDADQPVVPDAIEISRTAREMSDNNVAERRDNQTIHGEATPIYDPVAESERIRNNVAIRELIASFENYDNSTAFQRFDAFLDVFGSYGAPPVAAREGSQLANIRAQENALYYALGLSNPAELTDREMRDNMIRAIDRWMESVGVFLPGMLRYPSSDGFRFSPLTDRARLSLRSADVMATYDRSRIAQYLRELAALTPSDFMFYDPTGLGDLPLRERRDFLSWMDTQLRQDGVTTQRAAELRYVFQNGQLDLEELGLDDQASIIERLYTTAHTANDYYTMLKESVQQYDAGIISQGLA